MEKEEYFIKQEIWGSRLLYQEMTCKTLLGGDADFPAHFCKKEGRREPGEAQTPDVKAVS